METFTNIFKIKELRKKIFYTLFFIGIYRIGSHIPISGIDLETVKNLFSNSGLLGFINLFSGGALSRFSILALGIIPYINASIIFQLLTVVIPQIKEISEEGESGRKQIAQYTRYLAIVLALVQAVMLSYGFKNFVDPQVNFWFFLVYSSVCLVAGAAFVMWLGEVITEYGIGNGASLLIFIGIIAQMPFYVRNTYILYQGGTSLIRILLFVLILVLMLVGIVIVQESMRKIPVQYAKRLVGAQQYMPRNTYLPIRLIQGGVLPIIFASAILQFPAVFLQAIPFLHDYFNSGQFYNSIYYNVILCGLIIFFAYFYTALTFNPQEISDNIKKYGGFIVGVRPGKSTVEYLDHVLTKITFIGAIILAFIALFPAIAAYLTKVSSFSGLGGTALLIMVGVAMDLVKHIETYLITHRYEGVLNG